MVHDSRKEKALGESFRKSADLFTMRQEQELVLRLKKEELFDSHVMLPHAEINELVYRSVTAFVHKYRGEQMTITILTDPINDAIQNTFREIYRTHYADEHRKVINFLKGRLYRFLSLLGVSLGAYMLGDYLMGRLPGYHLLLNVIANVGTYCLWEVGNNHFASRSALEERKLVLRALNAKIEFVC